MKRIGIPEEEVNARLRLVSELNKLCLSLKRAKVNEAATKREPHVRSSERHDRNK